MSKITLRAGRAFYVPKELLEELDRTVLLEVTDLKLSDFERGFKAGQLEVVSRIKQFSKQQEALNG